ncbi:MAG: MFS transporter [Deltaproteobacteria bacterium]|nr:MFS transporter [Deltaproteobacteria bacterium]
MARDILIVLSITTFVVLLGVGIVLPILPIYAQGLGASATQIGLIFASFSLSKTICTPIIGALSDHTNRKNPILIGLILYSFIAITYVWAKDPSTLILIRLIHGIASAFILPIAMSYVGIIAEEGEEGLYMGSFNMALFLGMGAGPLLGGVLTDLWGVNAAFYALSILSAFAFTLTIIMLPPMPVSRDTGAGLNLLPFRRVLQSSSMKGLFFFRAISALGRGGLIAFIPVLAKASGISNAEIGILISANIFITGLFQRPFGRMVTSANKIRLVITGSIIGAVSLASLPFGNSFLAFFFLGSIMGIGGAMSIPAASVMVVENGKSLGMGATIGIFDMAMGLGQILGPLLAGFVMDIFDIDTTFYVSGILVFIGTCVFYYYTSVSLLRNHPQ